MSISEVLEEWLPLYLLVGFVAHAVLLSKAGAAKGIDTWTFNVIGILFPLIGWLYVIAMPARHRSAD